jgi:HD-GYP domain-containing protein (c-di-GMP phosphodiesterase class II)
MATQQVAVDDLTLGMFVVNLDRPWPENVPLRNRHRIASRADIELLKTYGVRFVIIDPTLSVHRESPRSTSAAEVRTQQSPATVPEPPATAMHALARELEAARAVRAKAMTVMHMTFEGVRTGAPINSVAVKRTVHTLIESVLQNHDVLISLNHIQQFDTDLFTHSLNVCVLALVVGKYQGFSKMHLESLGMGALLHDVGEIRLPRNLLHKQGAFTAQERQLIQRHPQLGVALLSRADRIPEATLRIVAEHHERTDGSGYPAGLRSVDVAPMSEIVGIVDVYDAMLSQRVGRPALLPTEAVKTLYQRGLKGEFDLRWIERIVRCIGIYPVGSVVELSTGECGIVTAANPADALRPSVTILWDAARRMYCNPRVVCLATPEPNAPDCTIVRAFHLAQEQLTLPPSFTSTSESHTTGEYRSGEVVR